MEEFDLNKATIVDTIKRGVKKLTMELTSVKFLTLCFIGFVTYMKVLDGYLGLMGILAILGIREGKEFLEQKLSNLANKQ